MFVLMGVILQCSSILCESTRLTLVQVLLQVRAGLKGVLRVAMHRRKVR